MTDNAQTQIELNIAAFVNGQLDAALRYEVLDYLAHHPDRAAEVMAELRLTEGLRLSLAGVETPAKPELKRAAERMAGVFPQNTGRRKWLPLVASVAIFALGWGAQEVLRPAQEGDEVAAIFDTALDAQDAVKLQAALHDGGAPLPQDLTLIANQLGIDLPDMPPGWTISAAQIVATPERPGLAVIIDSPTLGEILLFGVVRSEDGPDGPPTLASRDGRTLAFFERDQTAFVLVDASGTMAELRRGAEALRHRFN